jgi:hypothetical protein
LFFVLFISYHPIFKVDLKNSTEMISTSPGKATFRDKGKPRPVR